MAKFIKKSLACSLALIICLTCMLSSLTFSAETITGSFSMSSVTVAPGTEFVDFDVTVTAPGANELLMKVTTAAGEVVAVSSEDADVGVDPTSQTISVSAGYTLDSITSADITVRIKLADTETVASYPVVAKLLSAASRYEDKYVIPTLSAYIYVNPVQQPTYSYYPYTVPMFQMGNDAMIKNSGVNIPSNLSIVEGGDDLYALEIIGDGQEHELSLYIAKKKVPDSTDFNISFSAKVSSEEALSAFSFGIMNRWWNAITPSTTFEVKEGNAGITEITTDWNSFTGTCTSPSNSTENYNFVYIKYNLPEGEALYLDSISITPVDDPEQDYFRQGSFEAPKFVIVDEEPEDAILDVSVNATNSYNTIGGRVIAIDSAISGQNVLALGFNDTAADGRIWFNTGYVRPRETYKAEMWVMYYGAVSNFSANISDNDSTVETAEGETPIVAESITLCDISDIRRNKPGVWFKVEKTWTDPSTAEHTMSWSGLNLSGNFAADSGVIIDSISITPLHEGFAEENMNLFTSSGFEDDYVLPEVVWNDTYTTNGDIMDLSFMNSLPKTVGVLGNNIKTDYNEYFDLSDKNGDFSFLDVAFIEDTKNLDIVKFETQKALDNGREIWLNATYLVCPTKGSLADDWQKRLDKSAYTIQSMAGDKFQGIYFDEPGFHFGSNEQFVEVTKYIRETYKKRVFSMCTAAMFRDDYYFPLEDDDTTNDEDPAVMVYVTAESHKYVTDIGYWAYTPNTATNRSSKFDTYCAKLDINVRKWICALMGKYNAVTTEDKNIEIFNTMVNGAKDNNNFGGIVLWDTYSTHGYECLKPDETGVAPYDEFRNLLAAASKDFESKDSWLSDCGRVTSDNVVVLNNTVMSDDFINSFSPVLQSKLTLLYSGAQSSTPRQLVNNTKVSIKVASITTTTDSTYTFALANDVNCDNKVSASDLVRAKRIVAEDVAGNKLSFAAAGTDTATGMSVSNVAAVRAELLK